jgi:hypothetical protein
MAVAAGVALLLAGWWVLRAPAIERHAMAPPPDIDIDPPATRARREAAIALAMAPDDPWTFAESMASSAPGRAEEKEHCGIEGRPSFDEPRGPEDVTVQVGGASPGYAAAQARIDAALRSSPDPLDRAVADWLNVGDMRSGSGRGEAVVQQAIATTDARLYALAYGICHSAPPQAPGCGAISLERWAELDGGNGTPLIGLLAQAQARGDPAGLRAAMARLASATRFDLYFHGVAGAVASRVPKDEDDLAAVHDLAVKAAGQEAALTMPPFQTLIQVCRGRAGGDEELAQACRSVSDVMFEHTDNLIAQSISGALLFQATGDASRREAMRAELAIASAHWTPATGFSECHDMRETLKKMQRFAAVGEVEAVREQARSFITP